MMKGTSEPLADPWFALLIFLSIAYTCPWVAPNLPENVEDLSNMTINGIPW